MEETQFNLAALEREALSPAKAAWLLLKYPSFKWSDQAERNSVIVAVSQATKNAEALPKAPQLTSERSDPRGKYSPAVKRKKILCFCEYELIHTAYSGSRVSLVREMGDSDVDAIILLSPINNFFSFSTRQTVCQFPYEGGIVRKDLVPLTVRRYCYTNNGHTSPYWWLPCFDLSTEFHFFCGEYDSRFLNRLPNSWILKPAVGTQAKGHIFIPLDNYIPEHNLEQGDLSESFFSKLNKGMVNPEVLEVLHVVAENCPLLLEEKKKLTDSGFFGGDRIAQLVVERPLLIHGKKYDWRLFVVVRSFVPFEAYVYNLFYARLSLRPYPSNLLEALNNPHSSLTVCAYDEDPEIASQQARMFSYAVQDAYKLTRPELYSHWTEIVIQPIHTLLSELFSKSAPSIGTWPSSRAYYGVDIIFDDSNYFYSRANHSDVSIASTTVEPPAEPHQDDGNNWEGVPAELYPTPKLLEVNFMPDFAGMQDVCGENVPLFQSFVTDVVDCLLTSDDVDPARFTRLSDCR